jgi:hypothetical protein
MPFGDTFPPRFVPPSSSWSKQLSYLGWTLEERQTLLCLQETGLEVQEVILAEELERNLHPPGRRDLSMKLDKACICMDWIDDERASEAV